MRDVLTGLILALVGAVWGHWRGVRAARAAAAAARTAAVTRAQTQRNEVEDAIATQTDLLALALKSGLIRRSGDRP
ncbi:hypothetical protein BVG79_01701 [Ketogulonicigenium robustum]|uniref:Uncharacterized protein n=1 Tax=Ketogulonicigenium robustum TaxID=92947 RepID=A0A1W6P0K8_9RHOB|nr:hypothetical protein [Ketogulonicigenium robustum]ARO15045.1 hypothetical protein BVG79_01701 [Ketogulonicigenium robustum]